MTIDFAGATEARKKRYGKNDFSPVERDKLIDAARDTWGGIAPDVLASSEKSLLRRSEVIEIVLDADHMRGSVNDASLYLRWRDASRTFKHDVMREAFPDSYYGG